MDKNSKEDQKKLCVFFISMHNLMLSLALILLAKTGGLSAHQQQSVERWLQYCKHLAANIPSSAVDTLRHELQQVHFFHTRLRDLDSLVENNERPPTDPIAKHSFTTSK